MDKVWYKLDNAAKIFPATNSHRAPTTFRLSAIFFESIDKKILQQATQIALERFHPFNVQIRKGVFWYYLERNHSDFFVKEEDPFLYQSIDIKGDNEYLFNVFYYGKRICLEIWHGLTDANGAMEFLKAICFNYLNLLNIKIENDGSIITDKLEIDPEEGENSFAKYYNRKEKKPEKIKKSFVIKGKFSKEDNIGVYHGKLNVDEVRESAQKYNATITEYIGGVMLYSVYYTYKNNNPKNLPFVLFIPINLRKRIPSKTLKNFILYIRSTIDTSNEVTLESTIDCVKNTLREELTEDYLNRVLKGNVGVEKNLAVRPAPLFLKDKAMSVGYKLIGEGTLSIVFSNIGVVKTPKEMQTYIDRFEFGISPSNTLPITFSGVSYNGKLVLTLSKKILDKEMIKNFFRFLSKENEVIINANDLGGQ